jgi:pimeloyl-[acyl-carrier protein] synthase
VTVSPTDERYNLLAPEALTNRYALYRHLQADAPLYWSNTLASWVVVRYRDVAALLSDPRLSSNRLISMTASLPESTQDEIRPLRQAFTHWMVFLDPPDHTRVRVMINKAFTPRLVASMRPRIQAIVDGLLDEVSGHGRMDVVQDLAYPLPAIVVAELLGARPEDRGMIKVWSDDIARFSSGRRDRDTWLQIQNGVIEMTEYFRTMLANGDVRENTLLNNLITPDEQGHVPDLEDILATAAFLMFAGHETTTNLIANGIYTLLTHPDQLRRLESNSELIKSAVEEMLRYESPVQFTGRMALADIMIDDTRICAGQGVLLGLGASNHDASQFLDPERFDIARTDNRHLAFGYGPHFCVGAALARLEGQIAIETVLRRHPGLGLETTSPEWMPSLGVRALRSLPVLFDLKAHY